MNSSTSARLESLDQHGARAPGPSGPAGRACRAVPGTCSTLPGRWRSAGGTGLRPDHSSACACVCARVYVGVCACMYVHVVVYVCVDLCVTVPAHGARARISCELCCTEIILVPILWLHAFVYEPSFVGKHLATCSRACACKATAHPSGQHPDAVGCAAFAGHSTVSGWLSHNLTLAKQAVGPLSQLVAYIQSGITLCGMSSPDDGD
jgi:hypothetical protein